MAFVLRGVDQFVGHDDRLGGEVAAQDVVAGVAPVVTAGGVDVVTPGITELAALVTGFRGAALDFKSVEFGADAQDDFPDESAIPEDRADLHGVDERLRTQRRGLPGADFSVFYHLLSIDRNSDVRIKVALIGEYPVVKSITNIWANANWYERETWDLFGIKFEGHPNLQRILLPRYWKGHPLRKEYPARATEFDPYLLTAGRQDEEQNALKFNPEEWGMKRSEKDHDYMFLNLGRTIRPRMVRSASCCSSMARRSSTASRTSATTTVVPKRWPSASPGTPSFRTPTASTTWVG